MFITNKDWDMKKAINQELMRANNKKSILELILKKAPISKIEIANTLGLSSTTVANFINELSSENKITNCGVAKSTGGRKSALYQVNPEAFYIIGIDLQVDRVVCVLTNSVGTVLGTKESLFSNKDEWHVINLLNKAIEEIIYENNIPDEKIGGVGIGVPGIVQNASGIIELAPNLGWQNVNLRQLLNIDTLILIENEANAAAIGEQAFGVAAHIPNLIFISVGMGIGCGLIFNGKLFTGQSYHAGEFGHMTVEPAGLTCRCGNQGCWEVYASNDATLKLYNQISDHKIYNFAEFLELVEQDDSYALDALESSIKYLGIGIANLVNGLNPQMVIIGGELTKLKGIIYHKLLKQIKDRSLDKTFGGFSLEFSQLKNQATALGMASLVLDALFGS
jgi:Transcriptional regulator/sugar kinase